MSQPSLNINEEARDQIARTFVTLHGSQPVHPAELRVLWPHTAPLSGCFTDPGAFADAAAGRYEDLRANLYLTLNPVVWRAPMNQGTISRAPKGGVAGDDDIARLR